MKRSVLARGVVMAAALAAPACDSEVQGGGGGSGGSNGEGGGPQPPPACADSADTVLAVSQIFLGETNRDGSPNNTNGWKQYGLNLDGRSSTVESTDLCQPAAGGAPAMVYPDGDAGIDNSFGRNVLPVLLGLDPAPSAQANEAIDAGETTLILKIERLGATSTCNAVTKLHRGTSLGHPPLFDGSDAWPVDPDLLVDPADIESAKNVFAASSITDNVYRSGPEASFTLYIPMGGFVMALPIRHAELVMAVDPDRKGATFGSLGGVLDTEEFAAEFRKAIGALNPSLCEGSTMDSIMNQIRQASDILSDGTQDPAAICNGISIGLGFEMRAVTLGGVGPAAPPLPDPCGAP
ncbi:MAG: hypothetical protein IT372_17040 [Polyangiaceae bacterium]|nr:hypothetical protein [Polyangiaceae bacterium]